MEPDNRALVKFNKQRKHFEIKKDKNNDTRSLNKGKLRKTDKKKKSKSLNDNDFFKIIKSDYKPKSKRTKKKKVGLKDKKPKKDLIYRVSKSGIGKKKRGRNAIKKRNRQGLKI